MAFPHCDVNDLDGLLWTHVSLLSACAILILASFHSQLKEPAPYGRHADPVKAKAWGFPIPQRIGHMVSDALPGIALCLTVYLLYAGLLPPAGAFSEVRAVNVVLLCGWLLHYLYRGLLHPLITAYSSPTVAVGITLAGIFPNAIFSYLVAAQLACTTYPSDWAARPRFIIGVALYGVGTAINRWADLRLRAGRLAMRRRGSGRGEQQDGEGKQQAAGRGSGGVAAAVGGGGALSHGGTGATAVRESLLPGSGEGDSGDGAPASAPYNKQQQCGSQEGDGQAGVRSQYFIPRGGLFELVSCPNYTGELIEWTGYALAVWSWPALAWVLFCASTFIPRSLTNHRWYKQHFGEEYPASRKALIPSIL